MRKSLIYLGIIIIFILLIGLAANKTMVVEDVLILEVDPNHIVVRNQLNEQKTIRLDKASDYPIEAGKYYYVKYEFHPAFFMNNTPVLLEIEESIVPFTDF